MGIDYRDLPLEPIHRSRKCCRKCAFRPGSQEREDGYHWASMTEAFRDGQPFYCHESTPGHPQEVKDERPRWRTCAGYEAHRATGFRNMMRALGFDPEADLVLEPAGD